MTIAKVASDEEYRAWLKTKPQWYQDLAFEFSPGDSIEGLAECTVYVVGYGENDFLLLSEHNPRCCDHWVTHFFIVPASEIRKSIVKS